jgi:hypothetical protein
MRAVWSAPLVACLLVAAAPAAPASPPAAPAPAKNPAAPRATTAAPAAADLCARREELVSIQPFKRSEPGDQDAFVLSTSPSDTEPIRLVEKVDLNDDGVLELLMEHPDQVARDAQYFGWYLDCGHRRFYPLLTEFAAEYELGKPASNGWRMLQLYYPLPAAERDAPSDTRADSATLRKVTFRFNGKIYVKIRETRTRRRP